MHNLTFDQKLAEVQQRIATLAGSDDPTQKLVATLRVAGDLMQAHLHNLAERLQRGRICREAAAQIAKEVGLCGIQVATIAQAHIGCDGDHSTD